VTQCKEQEEEDKKEVVVKAMKIIELATLVEI
jgi:hypothetical protein